MRDLNYRAMLQVAVAEARKDWPKACIRSVRRYSMEMAGSSEAESAHRENEN